MVELLEKLISHTEAETLNINAGGSGFTRGLIGFEENVYLCFMDDDIEESECIYRFFCMSTSILIFGSWWVAKFTKKHMLYEAGATYNEDSKTRGFAPAHAVNNNIDLRSSSSLNTLLVEEHIDYGVLVFLFLKKLLKN